MHDAGVGPVLHAVLPAQRSQEKRGGTARRRQQPPPDATSAAAAGECRHDPDVEDRRGCQVADSVGKN